jgi:hypothetical protein
LADLGDGSDLLKRYTARNPLRSKLFPKCTHLVTSPDIIARGIFTGKLLMALHDWNNSIILSYHRARGARSAVRHPTLCKTQAKLRSEIASISRLKSPAVHARSG